MLSWMLRRKVRPCDNIFYTDFHRSEGEKQSLSSHDDDDDHTHDSALQWNVDQWNIDQILVRWHQTKPTTRESAIWKMLRSHCDVCDRDKTYPGDDCDVLFKSLEARTNFDLWRRKFGPADQRNWCTSSRISFSSRRMAFFRCVC